MPVVHGKVDVTVGEKGKKLEGNWNFSGGCCAKITGIGFVMENIILIFSLALL